MNTEIIVAIIAAVVSLVISGVKIWYDKWKRKQNSGSDEFASGLASIREVYGILNELAVDTGAGRALLLKCENGGGIPKVGCELYSTVVYEAFEHLPPAQDQWNIQRIDKQYTEMLYDVYREGQYHGKTDEINKGDLKDLLTADGVNRFFIYSISTSNDKFTYLELDFVEDRELTAKERNVIRSATTQLKKIFTDADTEDIT